jgi:PIN domain nuclease of toxin-antitoxin system
MGAGNMPMIDLYFRGFVRGATVNKACDQDGNEVDVSRMSEYELAAKINEGKLIIELAPHLSEHVECQIEVFDCTASRYRPKGE